MKLIVTIPAYNEEKTIAQVIESLPKKFPGIDKTEILVVDDGSSDNTAKVAMQKGANVLKHKRNLGLAKTFSDALNHALELGADIIVNTDADNQYNQTEIPKLIEPIMKGNADIVLGSRFKGIIEYMPWQKKIGNKFATKVVNFVSNANVSDAQTGFRAFSRKAAMQLNVQSNYTYTQETIIQAMFKGLKIVEVPVEFRKREGKSRLISNIFVYALRAGLTILRSYLAYKPLKFFGGLGLLFIFAGLISGFRVFIHYLNTGLVSPYIPTALLSTFLLIVGVQIIVIGLLADINKQNRMLQESILFELKCKNSKK